MSESGVIPPREERQRWIGELSVANGGTVSVMVLGDSVIIGRHCRECSIELNAAQCEEFSRLYFEALRQAEEVTP